MAFIVSAQAGEHRTAVLCRPPGIRRTTGSHCTARPRCEGAGARVPNELRCVKAPLWMAEQNAQYALLCLGEQRIREAPSTGPIRLVVPNMGITMPDMGMARQRLGGKRRAVDWSGCAPVVSEDVLVSVRRPLGGVSQFLSQFGFLAEPLARKALILKVRRDVRVVEGARLEIDPPRAC